MAQTTEIEAVEEESPQQPSASSGAVWRLPVPVYRVTQLLGEQLAEALLERTTQMGADTHASDINRAPADTTAGRFRSHSPFPAPELTAAISAVQPVVAQALGICCHQTVPVHQLDVHNDGDFHQPHQGTTNAGEHESALSFIYFLHRTPRPFRGGEHRVFDSAVPLDSGRVLKPYELTWQDWEPEHDTILFFPPNAWHEVRPVSCPGQRHEDSRFSISGWLRHPGIPHPTQHPTH
ncbi:2OG-Fe(II) oxygenase [Streptomyces sp. NPDC059076]|uniref:2OG-Fe(II) oxygenase n=1 Tax=unclassified Streptomyces TaxID=2593676 RepID=UPI00369684C8